MQKYDGQWVHDKKSGNGILYQNDSMVYKGEWLNDTFHGFGELYFPNGELYYQGEWNDNEKNGNGIQYYKNQNIQYQGIWLNGQKTYGKFYDNEGTILFNGPHHNLNKQMMEFIEKETKKDFFILSHTKLQKNITVCKPEPIIDNVIYNVVDNVVDNVIDNVVDNVIDNVIEHKKTNNIQIINSELKKETGYINMITNFLKKYI